MARRSPEAERRKKEIIRSTDSTIDLINKLKKGVSSTDLLEHKLKTVELTPNNKEEYVLELLQQLPEVERVMHTSKETSINLHGKKILIVKFNGIEKVYVQVKSSAGAVENYESHVMDVCMLNTQSEYVEWINEQKIIVLVANKNELDSDIIKVFRVRLSEIRKFHGIE